MTGREMIIYILENNLEDDDLFAGGKLNGFYTAEEYALKIGCGTAAVKALAEMGTIRSITIGEEVYVYGERRYYTNASSN